jgi:hypothetical protein
MANAQKTYYDTVIADVRVVHPHIFTPDAAPIKGQPGKKADPRFSIRFLVPKTDQAKLAQLADVLIKEYTQVHGQPDQASFDAALANCRKDGDRPDAKDWEKGNWVFSASSGADKKPSVFDQRQQPLLDASAIYGGCYCHLHITASAGIHPGTGLPYLKFYLSQVMKARDGDRIGGGANASVFDGLPTTAPTAQESPFGGSFGGIKL